MWLMKTLLTSGCTNQRGAGHGNEDTQTKFVQEHGKDIASCSTNPGGAECKRGEAVNKAIAAALVGGLQVG